MALVLNTNINSLTAQNNLAGSQANLATALQRLSSGLRINSAADDAAGLAISQQFTTQINGTNQAVSNANDAVSEAQTTAGALNTIVDNLQSIRTLAVESANGSNSSSDRTALNNPKLEADTPEDAYVPGGGRKRSASASHTASAEPTGAPVRTSGDVVPQKGE